MKNPSLSVRRVFLRSFIFCRLEMVRMFIHPSIHLGKQSFASLARVVRKFTMLFEVRNDIMQCVETACITSSLEVIVQLFVIREEFLDFITQPIAHAQGKCVMRWNVRSLLFMNKG